MLYPRLRKTAYGGAIQVKAQVEPVRVIFQVMTDWFVLVMGARYILGLLVLGDERTEKRRKKQSKKTKIEKINQSE